MEYVTKDSGTSLAQGVLKRPPQKTNCQSYIQVLLVETQT